MEEWRTIPEWTLYEASSAGHVRRKESQRSLKPSLNRKGYFQVTLYRLGSPKGKSFRVHTLVTLAFIGPRPADKEVNHKSGIKTDNRITNLEYCAGDENRAHALLHGLHPSGDNHGTHTKPESVARGERQGCSKLTEEIVRDCRRRYAEGGISTYKLAAEHGVNQTAMYLAIVGKQWQSCT